MPEASTPKNLEAVCSCGFHFQVPAMYAGTKRLCPNCGKKVDISDSFGQLPPEFNQKKGIEMKIVLLVLGSILFAIGVGATVFAVFVAGAMANAHGPGSGGAMGRIDIFLVVSILVALVGAGLFGLAFKYE